MNVLLPPDNSRPLLPPAPGPAGNRVPPGFAAEGETFQHYQVLRREDGSLWELGRGAMGVTYKAFDTHLRCHVALKVINARNLDSETAGQRFIREARIAARLRHRNIATVYHLGVDPQGFFYSMEFVDGETLEHLVERVGPLPVEVVLRIALQTARALAAASRQGLIHRDIKPANLMVLHRDEEGEDGLLVKVIDFGLARSYSASDSNPQLTATGFVGTPLYASPEQLEEKNLDVRSDIYSLGVTLWILLTGRPPFTGKMTVVITQHLHAEPPWWQLDDCPEPARALLERMLCKDPAQRYQSAGELRVAIEGYLRDLTDQDDPTARSTDAIQYHLAAASPELATETVAPNEVADPATDGSMFDPLSALAGKIQAKADPGVVQARPPARTPALPLPPNPSAASTVAAHARRRLPQAGLFLAGATVALLCAFGLVSARKSSGTLDGTRLSAPAAVSVLPAAKADIVAFESPSPAKADIIASDAPPPAEANPSPEIPPADTAAAPAVERPSSLLNPSGAALAALMTDETGSPPPTGEPSAGQANDSFSLAVRSPDLEKSTGLAEDQDSAAAAAAATPALPAAAPTPNGREARADKASTDSPTKGRASTSSTRTRSRRSSRSAQTPPPNFLQKLFGIKPKPKPRSR